MTKKIITLCDIGRTYYTDDLETHALSKISLDIFEGEYVAFSGPSGCGKSTLLSILGLLDKASTGKYYLNDTPVSELNRSQLTAIRNREIGFIFQNFNLIGDMSVAENVELPLIYAGYSSSERKKLVNEALDNVEMSHRLKHLPGQLSGGQQQRIAIARAIVAKPSLILADEPTGNLDSKNGEAVMTLLDNLHRDGASICMVTHDPRYVNAATKQINLLDGKILAATHEDIFESVKGA
jgi:putative ABC transport system ATP-binding protein